MHLQHIIYRHDVLDCREDVGRRGVDVEVVERCVARGVVEGVDLNEERDEYEKAEKGRRDELAYVSVRSRRHRVGLEGRKAQLHLLRP